MSGIQQAHRDAAAERLADRQRYEEQLALALEKERTFAGKLAPYFEPCLALGLALPAASASAADWAKVADALGKSGTEMPGGVYRVGLPRTDLQVTLDGVQIKPTLALGSWLAFAPHGADQRRPGRDGCCRGHGQKLRDSVTPTKFRSRYGWSNTRLPPKKAA